MGHSTPLALLRLILGTQSEQLQIVQQFCSVLDWRKNGWDIVYCREELEQAMRQLVESHEHFIFYFPSSYHFLPKGAYQICGESSYCMASSWKEYMAFEWR